MPNSWDDEGTMTFMVPIALFGWIPATLLLFLFLPPRRAVLVSMLGAWMFLPMAAGYKIGPLPVIEKTSVCSAAALLGVALFDFGRLQSFRFRWFDLPMLVWTLVNGMSAAANGFGVHGAYAGVLAQVITWTIPYVLGRLYFRTLAEVRDLAEALFLAGLIYVPLCLLEIRLSPQLHRWVYGYHQHDFSQTIRFGGYRPMVFMQHGLAVAMWMADACIAGFWLWWAGGLRRTWGFPTYLSLSVLFITTILCRSTGALALLGVGLIALVVLWLARSRLILILLLIAAPLYAATRSTGLWSGQQLVDMADTVSAEDRAGSLASRMRNEDLLAKRALEQPLFGWSGWDRNAVYDDWGRRLTVGDGMWILTLGVSGVTGLVSFFLVLLFPAALLILRKSPGNWQRLELSGCVVLATILILTTIDCLFNAMYSPVWMLASAALSNVGGTALPIGVSTRVRQSPRSKNVPICG
jgi:hypothetical protein